MSYIFWVSFVLVWGVGCGVGLLTRDSSSVSRLEGRGMVGLSPENPYLAANVLVAEEQLRSPELEGFLRVRGTPNAVRASRSLWAGSTLELFYFSKREHYILDRDGSSWIIRGPFSLTADQLVELKALISDIRAKPVLLTEQELSRLRGGESAEDEVLVGETSATQVEGQTPFSSPLPEVPSKPQILSPDSKKKTEKSLMSDQTGSKAVAPKQGYSSNGKSEESKPKSVSISKDSKKAENPAQETLPHITSTPVTNKTRAGSGDPAPSSLADLKRLDGIIRTTESPEGELAPNGDLLHQVTFKGESIVVLAKWYTLDSGNAARIARVNQLSATAALPMGQSVTIPAYLLKNKKRLTEGALRALL